MKNKKYISVVGVDNLKHLAEPHKDVCLCGVKILRKRIRKNDKLFGCYECTY